VPVRSAFAIEMPARHRYLAYGTGHLELLGSRAVYERLRGWMARR
jgi:hypothetical protein